MHNHPEGIKGASAVAAAVFMARTGSSKDDIRCFVEARFGYDLARSVDDIRPTYRFDVSCQGFVPEAIIAFLESTDFEDAIRKAVSLGGDSDTIACVAGAIAGAFYGGVPAPIRASAVVCLDDRLRRVVDAFTERHLSG
jgi:ADP-ribosylglycohydrolase